LYYGYAYEKAHYRRNKAYLAGVLIRLRVFRYIDRPDDYTDNRYQ